VVVAPSATSQDEMLSKPAWQESRSLASCAGKPAA